MNENTFGEKLNILRKEMGLTQKEFSALVGIPQPSLSAYENGKNSPTADVLMNIADKCNVSLDWLCSRSNMRTNVSTLGDVFAFLSALTETEEIKLDFTIHDNIPGDMETETERWYADIRVYGNDTDHKWNADLCNIIAKVNDNDVKLSLGLLGEETYELVKEKTYNYYNKNPLTKKVIEDISIEEKNRRLTEYVNKQNGNRSK